MTHQIYIVFYNFSDKSDIQYKHSEHSSTQKKNDGCGWKVGGEKKSLSTCREQDI